MRLTFKFNLVLISVLLLGLAVTGLVSYRILQQNARNEITERAGMMMEAALAVRGYTVGEIRPLLALQMMHDFLPQSVPAYAATQTFNKLRETHQEYSYKEATLNPTNPRNRAVAWEADIIQEFRNHSERKEIVGVRQTPTGNSLYLARPIQIKHEACLTCHSTIEAAPKTMLTRYGGANGFGWKLNEIVGAQIVSVPMSVPIAQAKNAFYTFMTSLIAVFIVIIVILNLMLHSIIIKPVTTMSRLADEISRGKTDVSEFAESAKDEIGLLAVSFNRMRRSLEKAMKMLGE
jgi:HAMP domain-containing protein